MGPDPRRMSECDWEEVQGVRSAVLGAPAAELQLKNALSKAEQPGVRPRDTRSNLHELDTVSVDSIQHCNYRCDFCTTQQYSQLHVTPT
jgi:hypothetical protein